LKLFNDELDGVLFGFSSLQQALHQFTDWNGEQTDLGLDCTFEYVIVHYARQFWGV